MYAIRSYYGYHGKTDYPVQLTWHDVRTIAESEAPMRFISFGEFEITREEYRNGW